MALASLLKSAGISMDDIANAREQAAVVRQFIEQSAANTAAIANRLAAIDNAISNVRDMMMRLDANLNSLKGKIDGQNRALATVVDDLNDPER